MPPTRSLFVQCLLVTLLALTFSPMVHAADAWVNDEIYVPVRSGAGNGYRIVHRGLKSGTQVEVLGEQGDWINIRYRDTEGYIEKQYLSRTPTAALRLERISADGKEMESRFESLRSQVQELEEERDTLRTDNERLSSSLDESGKELDSLREVAADPIRLDRANRELNEELSMLRSDLDQVEAENAMLRSDNTSRQWITGVGILILGAVAGLLLKSKSGRRRGNWAN